MLIGAVGVFYFGFQKRNIPDSVKKLVVDKTTGEEAYDERWQTYTNERFGYEIKYHLDWRKQGENEPPYPPPPATMSFGRKWAEPLEVCDFEISSRDSLGTFAGEVESLSKDPENTRTEAKISGEKAVKFSLSNEIQLVESYYLEHNGNSYRMGFNILRGPNFNTCQQVFDLMVASFKFD